MDAAIGTEEATFEPGIWASYKGWARRNQSKLWLVDDALSRLLFLTSSSSRWRDIGWGLLELHRLILHQTTKRDQTPLYGTTVEVLEQDNDSATTTTTIRFILTIIQTLYPIVHEVLRGSPGDYQKAMKRQTTVRRYLERTRFVLRAVLLFRYWKTLQPTVPPGLLIRGGMIEDHERQIVTIQEEMSRIERQNYVGKRSGRHWSVHPMVPTDPWTIVRTKCAELLYILRPLVYAECGGTVSVWAMALAMDLVSLWGLNSAKTAGNADSSKEWNRRRLRLLLYALRAPVWDRYGAPAAERVGTSICSVPLLGGLLHNYFWDWISYWKEYRLEEG